MLRLLVLAEAGLMVSRSECGADQGVGVKSLNRLIEKTARIREVQCFLNRSMDDLGFFSLVWAARVYPQGH